MVAGAVDDARRAVASGAPAEQLDLLASEDCLEPDASEVLAIQRARGGSMKEAVAEWRAQGARGRKPGAVNRSTADLARYLGQFGPDPAVKLMRMIARPVDLLAAELGCSLGDAWDRQARVAMDLMPYFHGKKPVAIDMTVKGDFHLAIAGITHSAGQVEQLRAEFADVPEGDGEDADNADFFDVDAEASE